MIRTPLLLAAAAVLIPAALHAQDPCALLTPDQIKSVLNSPVEPGQPGVAKDSNECVWSDARGVDRVTIALRPGAEFRNILTKIEKAGGHPISVTGIGDDAFFVSSEDASSSALYVLAKNHFLLLAVYGSDASQQDIQAAEKALAAQIIPKL